MEALHGFVGLAGEADEQQVQGRQHRSIRPSADLTLLLAPLDDGSRLRTFHIPAADATLTVFGDRILGGDSVLNFGSLEQALLWVSLNFTRFCGVWCRGRRIELFTDHAAAAPLFYTLDGSGTLRFACRVAELAAVGVSIEIALDENRRPLPAAGASAFRGIAAVPPGHVVSFEVASGRAQLSAARAYTELPCEADVHDEPSAQIVIAEALSAAVVSCLDGAQEIALTLSGGVDSAAVAFLARPHVSTMHSFTVGTPYGNEFAEARVAAQALRSNHREFEMSLADARRLLPAAIECFETWDPLTLQIALPVCFLYEQLGGAHPVVLTGYGSDLIFGGIVDKALPGAAVDRELRRQVALTVPTNELSPVFAGRHGVVVRYPFWDRRVLRDGLRVAGALKTLHGIEKYVFRKAMTAFVPDQIVWRRKLGIHEGSAMKKLFCDLLGTSDDERQVEHLRGIAQDVLASRQAAVR